MSGMEVPLESRLKYLKRRKEEIKKIKEAAEPDWDFLKKVGHQIKGNAVTFLFPDLTKAGERLELAALSQDIAQVKEACRDLEILVDQLSQDLSKMPS